MELHTVTLFELCPQSQGNHFLAAWSGMQLPNLYRIGETGYGLLVLCYCHEFPLSIRVSFREFRHPEQIIGYRFVLSLQRY